MQAKRFGVKIFTQDEIAFDLAALVPIFQRWIQQHSVEGLLIDVADYKHVYQGPGVMLIGHEGNYSFDLRGGRAGVLYVRKRELQSTLTDDMQLAFRLAREASRQLESEAALNGVRFDETYAEVIFYDRLATPNTREAFEMVRGVLQAAALYPDGAQIESVEADARKPLTVRVSHALEKVTG